MSQASAPTADVFANIGAGMASRSPSAALAANALFEGSGVRALTQTGRIGDLPAGYGQSGTIAYDGFSVVEQNASRGNIAMYNKADLLHHPWQNRASTLP